MTSTAYLDYPSSKLETASARWLLDRRPDWGNPVLGEVLDPAVVAHLRECATDWESLVHTSTGDRKARIVNYCHEKLYCGVCASSTANERASTWLEHFRAVQQGARLGISALWTVFTLPKELSEQIAERPDRKAILDGLFKGIDGAMRSLRFKAWVKVIHFASSENPTEPHVHYPTFIVPLDEDGRPVPGFVKGKAFDERRRSFLDAWGGEVERVCERFNLRPAAGGRFEVQNLRLGYCKDMISLEKKLRYELRPVMQDSMRQLKDASDLRRGIELTLRFLYPLEGMVMAYRRIRGGGAFGARSITKFIESLGFEKVEKPDDSENWESEGRARLVADRGEEVEFVLCATGERFTLRRDQVSTAAHGCPFSWERVGDRSRSGGGHQRGDGGADLCHERGELSRRMRPRTKAELEVSR